MRNEGGRGGGRLRAEVLGGGSVPAAVGPWSVPEAEVVSEAENSTTLLTHGRIEGVTGMKITAQGAEDQTPPPPFLSSLGEEEQRTDRGLQRSRLETPCGTGKLIKNLLPPGGRATEGDPMCSNWVWWCMRPSVKS
ncbi:unnamed protein product [Boreogadus saida]